MKRNYSIDLIKIIAMLGVISLHTTHNYLEFFTGKILYETSVMSIPLFFMCSGYVLLGRQDVDYKYVVKKWGGC